MKQVVQDPETGKIRALELSPTALRVDYPIGFVRWTQTRDLEATFDIHAAPARGASPGAE